MDVTKSANIIELFKQSEFREHPVWILLGDLDKSQSIASSMVESVSNKIGYYDTLTIELTRPNLPTLDKFLSLHALNVRILVCIIKGQDEYVNAAILKKVEEVPDNTVFILIAQALDSVLYNRGLVFKLDESPVIEQAVLKSLDTYTNCEEFLDKLTDYEPLPDTINYWLEQKMVNSLKQNQTNVLHVGYRVWKEFAEIRSWIRSYQLSKTQATEMMLSMLEMSHLL